jgi:hypothetical protein
MRLAKLAEAIKEPVGTLDQISALLKSIEYGDMMRLARDLSVLLVAQEGGDVHNVAAALYAYAVKDQVQDAPPAPPESPSEAVARYQAVSDEVIAPRLAKSRPAYHDQPAAGLSATYPTLRGDECGEEWQAIRSSAEGKA